MYFFDTYALFEILRRNIDYADFEDDIIITSTLNIGELYYRLLQETSSEKAMSIIKSIRAELLNNIHQDIIIHAMEFKYQHKKKKLSMVDCIGYMLAKQRNLVFLTGDKEFENLPNVKFVK